MNLSEAAVLEQVRAVPVAGSRASKWIAIQASREVRAARAVAVSTSSSRSPAFEGLGCFAHVLLVGMFVYVVVEHPFIVCEGRG